MTDPQLPPPPPYGSTPPIPPAPGGHPVAPSFQSPPGAYTAPVGGYVAPAAAPHHLNSAYQAPPVAGPKSAALGVIAFMLSIVASVVTPIIGGIAGYQIGFGLPTITSEIDSATSDLAFLSPVRDQVLMGEIGFWVGTLAGIVAIVLGIMAIAKRQGRAWGIIALVLGVIGPVIFFVALSIALASGAGAGAISQHS